ncbi:nuclear transport factor 2 family protein, partial [Rhizobiaceae sp. 2RAB30]
RDAGLFGPEGQTHFEVLHAASGEGVAYWTGIQCAVVRIGDRTEAMPMDLRVTEVFRREDGAWKLVHRHADTLVSAPARK